jgi:uncharacterized protein YdhG (YjbR/CyaY superfamily)
MPGNPVLNSSTVDDYIAAAPAEARVPLQRLREILRGVAPQAQEAMKWNTPFFIEPRFLFAFSAHKAHLNLAPSQAALDAFRNELEAAGFKTGKGTLQLPYKRALPEALIRRMAEHQLQLVSARQDEAFW